MKLYQWLILGTIIGVLIGWLLTAHTGRYVLVPVENSVMRIDTATGKSWLFVGSWKPVAESQAKVSDAPMTFQSDAPR